MMTNADLLTADNTNAQPLFCRHCGSQFLGAEKARHEDHEATRAHLQRVAAQKDKDTKESAAVEVTASCWRVDDMWDFE